jgi:hypothetical protein
MFNIQIIICILEKKTARHLTHNISLIINNIKFFDMSKSKTKNPVLQRNGVKNSYCYSL